MKFSEVSVVGKVVVLGVGKVSVVASFPTALLVRAPSDETRPEVTTHGESES